MVQMMRTFHYINIAQRDTLLFRENSNVRVNVTFQHGFKSVIVAILSKNKRLLISMMLLWTHFSWEYTMHFVPVHLNYSTHQRGLSYVLRKLVKFSPIFCIQWIQWSILKGETAFCGENWTYSNFKFRRRNAVKSKATFHRGDSIE